MLLFTTCCTYAPHYKRLPTLFSSKISFCTKIVQLKPVQNSKLPFQILIWFQSNTFQPFIIWNLNSCLTNLTVQIKSSLLFINNLIKIIIKILFQNHLKYCKFVAIYWKNPQNGLTTVKFWFLGILELLLCKICLQFISSVLILSNSCLEFKLKKWESNTLEPGKI